METIEKRAIGSRISELMFRLKINQRGLAQKIGVSHTTIRNVVNDITKPRYEFLESILNAYPNINKDWLMEGKGEMFNNDDSSYSQQPTMSTPELWQDLKTQMEARIKELEIFKFLYCQEKGIPNFLDVSEVPPVPFIKKEMQIILGSKKTAFLSIG